jgi:hypothetical protein
MSKYIITFGPDHAAYFGFPDYRSYAVIVAYNAEEARKTAFATYGDRWCNLHPANKVDLSRFPGGQVSILETVEEA